MAQITWRAYPHKAILMDVVSFLWPSYAKNNFDSFQIEKKLMRPIMAVGFPRTIREGWLDCLVSSPLDFDISMHIAPSNPESTLTQLNRELVKQESDILAAQMKGIVNPSLKIQHEDTLKVLEKLQKGEEKLFNLSLYFGAFAKKPNELDMATGRIVSEISSTMIVPKFPYFRMYDAVKSILPMQQDMLKATRNITSGALSACFPFTTTFMREESGVIIGVSRKNNVPVLIDPFKMANHNGLILGTSGSGKSVAAKIFIIRSRLCGVKTIIIDPQGEYKKLAAELDGQIIKISDGSEFSINPFDMMGFTYHEKTQGLMEFFLILLGINEKEQVLLLDRAIHKIYRDSGILQENPNTWIRPCPKLLDLYNELLCEQKKKGGKNVQLEHLLLGLRPFAKGSYSFLNKGTSIKFEGNITCFDISALPEMVKPAIMFLVLEFAEQRMYSDKGKKLLVIDEAWSLLAHAQSSGKVFALVKTARKFGLGVLIITQEVSDLLGSDAGRTVLANSAWKFLARQEHSAIEGICQKFLLNENEQRLLAGAQQGEGLLIAMNEHFPIKVICSEKEYAIVTTKFDEN